MTSTEILGTYEKHRTLYAEFAGECEQVVKKLLIEAGLKFHAVTSRPKDMESLARKLSLPGKSYAELDDVTDLAGVRVVTFFADDVDFASKVIEEHFEVDWSKSIDKRQSLAPGAFGYLSVHYVARLNENRRRLPENARFRDLVFEIQVRSILQHAWAEIQHDLGYKSYYAIPLDYERRFSRLAGLFELADDEFIALRAGLVKHAASVRAEVSSHSKSVEIDKDSLVAYVSSDSELAAADAALARGVWGATPAAAPDADYLQALVPILLGAGLNTIDDLRRGIELFSKTIVDQAKRQHGEASGGWRGRPTPRGAALFRLSLLVLAARGVEAIVSAITAAGWNLEGAHEFAEGVVASLGKQPQDIHSDSGQHTEA